MVDVTVPRKPAAKYVDTASGDRFDLEDSGLVPKFTNKKVSIAVGVASYSYSLWLLRNMVKYRPTWNNGARRWRQLRENMTAILMRVCAEARWSRFHMKNGECTLGLVAVCHMTVLCVEKLC